MNNAAHPKRAILASSLWLIAAVLCMVIVVNTVPSASGAAHQLPRLWPGVAVALMMIGGLAVFGEELARHRSSLRKVSSPAPPADDAPQDQEEVQQTWAHLLIVIAVICYIVVISYIGFIVATAALFFSIAMTMRARNPVRVGLVAIVIGFVTAYFFGELLSVALPRGAGFLDDLSRFIY
jgi:uncharacterized membrane protein YhaH (DUF805 family)